jgi:hypothetical protein
MKVTFDNNHSSFTFEFDFDKFGEGSFSFVDVKCLDHDIVDVTIQFQDVWTTQHIGEIEIDYILNEQEWKELEHEVKRQILEEPFDFDAHEFMSDEERWKWHAWEQQQIEQSNEDKF